MSDDSFLPDASPSAVAIALPLPSIGDTTAAVISLVRLGHHIAESAATFAGELTRAATCTGEAGAQALSDDLRDLVNDIRRLRHQLTLTDSMVMHPNVNGALVRAGALIPGLADRLGVPSAHAAGVVYAWQILFRITTAIQDANRAATDPFTPTKLRRLKALAELRCHTFLDEDLDGFMPQVAAALSGADWEEPRALVSLIEQESAIASTLPPCQVSNSMAESRSPGNVSPENCRQVRHGDEYEWLDWFGKHYTFTPGQRPVVQELVRAWKAAEPGVLQEKLIAKAGSSASLIRDVFRSSGRPHDAWQDGVIREVEGARGFYSLHEPRTGSG
jgi:hypothetical protein